MERHTDAVTSIVMSPRCLDADDLPCTHRPQTLECIGPRGGLDTYSLIPKEKRQKERKQHKKNHKPKKTLKNTQHRKTEKTEETRGKKTNTLNKQQKNKRKQRTE